MEDGKVDKWNVYMNIKRLRKQGFTITQVARKLGISRNTVYKYMKKDPEEMALWMASSHKKSRKLDRYKEVILGWLEKHSDLTAAQIQDWLKEQYPDVTVGDSTVRMYVASLREEYGISRTVHMRQYEAVPDPPMGQQAQVDFGTCKVRKGEKTTEIRLWFITFVLSHSRFKYVEWLDRPFTTKDVINAHERAFEYFGGMPKELVYDQDILISVNENGGDIQLTEAFQGYVTYRKFKVHLCRKADPESKGKIENVVGYIKKNFAKHRPFYNLEKWNEKSLGWLERTGNGNIHNTTKKRPIEVHQLEKEHLQSISFIQNNLSITRIVRKDNTIRFRSNRYSVPIGTYKPTEETIVYLTVTAEQELIIQKQSSSDIILARHPLSLDKGKLIQHRNHRRDWSRGISEWIDKMSQQFEDATQAYEYLEKVRQNYPRYIRDQLQIIENIRTHYPTTILTQALDLCIRKKLYSANDFRDVIQVLTQRNPQQLPSKDTFYTPPSIETQVHSSLKADTRSLDMYVSILKGDESSCV
ncbi:IS21 family transposase [Priestia megaterium]|uniref:IS21 family transposase n=1 Tax=Priestia TaxID=2800373 RepID=UPI00196B3E97|nr:IS21 family transposase [Priestia megaterium]QSF42363.1 IS21 family transposase [Priestia megaterium]